MTPPKSNQQVVPPTAPARVRPHVKDAEEVRRAFDEVERGDVLDAASSEQIMHWLDVGEGPCPSPAFRG